MEVQTLGVKEPGILEKVPDAVHSVAGFLAKMNDITREFEEKRPSRLQWISFARWQREKHQKIASIMESYAGREYDNMLALRPAQPMQSAIAELEALEALEKASDCLVKSTCMIEKARKKVIRFNFDRVFRYQVVNDKLDISFVVRNEEANEIKFSENYRTNFEDITIVADIPIGKLMWLSAEWGCESHASGWIKNAQFHVHSEKDLDFLLPPK